jgi:hypothetical protein
MFERDSANQLPLENPSLTRYVLASSPAFIIGFIFGLGMILRDCSITCNVGYKFTPLAIIAVGLASIPVSSLTVRMSNRWSYQRWQITSLVAIAFTFLLFWASSYLVLTRIPETTVPDQSGSLWTFPLGLIYLSYFIWLGAIGAAVKPNLKNNVYRLFPGRGRERALAITSAAVIMGGLLGAWLVNTLGSTFQLRYDLRYEVARDSSLIFMAAFILLIIPIIILIARRTASQLPETPAPNENDTMTPSPARINLRDTLRIITADPKLKRIGALIFTTGVAETTMIFLFYWLVNDQVPITNGRGMFFAHFYIWLNASTLFFLIFGTNRLINRFGLLIALGSLPIALLFGSVFLILQTAIAAMYTIRIIYSALEQSLYGQGMDRLILEVGERQAPQVRQVLHGLTIRMGRGLGAVLVMILALGAGISFTHLTGVFMVVLLIWAGISLSLRHYLHKSSLLFPPTAPHSALD